MLRKLFNKLFGDRKQGAKATVQGKPIYVNLPPASTARKRRYMARIALCKCYMDQLDPTTPEYQSWEGEYMRRTDILEKMGGND